MNLFRAFWPKNLLFAHQQISLFHHSNFWSKLVQFNLSDIGEGIAEVQLKEWHVKEGDKVSEFDELCSVQSDKASVTITSRYNGTIRKLHYKADDIAKVGQPLVDIETPTEDEATLLKEEEHQQKSLQSSAASTTTTAVPDKILASPAVRRLIRESGIEVKAIVGSGKDGRVLKEDVLRMIGGATTNWREQMDTISKFEKVEEPSSSSSDDDDGPAERKVPIRGYTRAMVKTMSEALKIPHFGYSDEVFADRLVEAKRALELCAEQKGVKLSFLPLIIKATSLSLRDFPQLNASLDSSMEHLVYKRSHNISLAMDTPDGLAVPNIKNCQRKSIWEIASELAKLRERGAQGRFTADDLCGGTFALSNIGSIGGTYMSPVILPPQVAIGAIGSIRKVPRFDDNGKLVTRHVLNLSWSADHRVVDGATVARFSNRLKQYLEAPELMLAELR